MGVSSPAPSSPGNLGSSFLLPYGSFIVLDASTKTVRIALLRLSTPLWEFLIRALFENYLCLFIKIFMNIVRTIVETLHRHVMAVLMRRN